MPRIASFNGISIFIYSKEHLPPHFHAIYAEYEVLLLIETGDVFKGYLPANKMRETLEWYKVNSERILKNYYELNPHLK